MSRRKINDTERLAFGRELADLEVRQASLKDELRDNGKAIRDEIKTINKRIYHLAAVLKRGDIEEEDQLALVETEEVLNAD